jgi:hypothetical protein
LNSLNGFENQIASIKYLINYIKYKPLKSIEDKDLILNIFIKLNTEEVHESNYDLKSRFLDELSYLLNELGMYKNLFIKIINKAEKKIDVVYIITAFYYMFSAFSTNIKSKQLFSKSLNLITYNLL